MIFSSAAGLRRRALRRSQAWNNIRMVDSNRVHHWLMISSEMEGSLCELRFFRANFMPVITWAWMQNLYFLEVGLPDADKGRELGVDLPGTTSGSSGGGGYRGHISACRILSAELLLLSTIVAYCCHLDFDSFALHFNIIIYSRNKIGINGSTFLKFPEPKHVILSIVLLHLTRPHHFWLFHRKGYHFRVQLGRRRLNSGTGAFRATKIIARPM